MTELDPQHIEQHEAIARMRVEAFRARHVMGLMVGALGRLHDCYSDCSADAASWPEPQPHHDLDSPAWHYFHP